jgi:hypothetical protein
MYNPPWYVWAISVVEAVGFAAATCFALYYGARIAGSSRARAGQLAAAAGVVLGGWFTVSGVIAAGGGYHTLVPPWLPIAAGAVMVALLAMSRIPAVARALASPSALVRLTLPHAFRVAGVAFLMMMALGHMPALFALPAGLGDIAIGIQAPFVARRLARGTGHRGAIWFHVLGIADLVNALILGGLTAFHIVHVSPANDALSLLPIALIPSAGVPLLLALHIVSLRRLLGTSQTRQPTAAPAAVVVS